MPYRKKSWTEKYETETEPKIEPVPSRMARIFGKGTMLIATPRLVDACIRKIPKGKVTTINAIRKKLAEDFHADITCPITTGIFTWIVACKSAEDKLKGIKRISPYWRVIKEDGSLNPKYPGGIQGHSRCLSEEGFAIVPNRTGSKLMVKDFEKKLFVFKPDFIRWQRIS